MRTQRRATSSRTLTALFLLLSLAVLPCIVNPSKSLTVPVRAKTIFASNLAKKDRTCTSCSPRANQEIYIPLIDLPESQNGELVFNSRSPETMSVTPVFYKRNGQAVVADSVEINSAEIRYVDIKTLLPRQFQRESDWGGFALTYYGTNREMWSQFRFMRVNGGGNVDEFFTVKDESRSAVYDATWWMASKSQVVIGLGNISDSPTSAKITFGNGHVRNVELQARASAIVREEYPGGGPESVHIAVDGAAGSIVPTGLITKRDGSFNSVIRFYDPTKAKQSNLYANGFRIKRSTPHLVLKNTTDQSIAVSPKIIPLSGSNGSLVLPQVSLLANETKEIDLSELSEAAKQRNDLDVVSVEITNWAAPGSLIGSLYDIDSRSGVDYDVPLRDSGPIRSMTGVYPWRIDRDYKSLAYVTNITDEPREFVAELAFDAATYTLGPRTLSPRETAVFDFEQIRDQQVRDIAGKLIPKTASHGQFKWAQRGVAGGRIVMIGRMEMVSRQDNVSTSYSCPTDCGPRYDVSGSIPTDPLFNGQAGVASVTETASWNYGYTMGPYPVSAQWSAEDPIVSFDSSSASNPTLSPEDAGETVVTGFVGWYDYVDFDGLNCVWAGTYPGIVESLIDTFAAVEFLDARIYSTGGEYSGDHGTFLPPPFNSVDLQTHSSSVPSACGGDNFILKVTFRLPDHSDNCCLSSETSFVTVPVNHKFNVAQVIPDPDTHAPNSWQVLWFGADSPPYVQIGLKANGPGSDDAVRIRVGGEYQSHERYSGFGTVHIKCPQ